MKHTRRQIELDEIWTAINAGKYSGSIGPQTSHVGPGIDSMTLPLSSGGAEIYERSTGEGWKMIPFVGHAIPSEMENAQPLRSRTAYWDAGRPDILSALKVPPEALSHTDLVQLARELDRRFMQLADKVDFERKHDLVNYSPLDGSTKRI